MAVDHSIPTHRTCTKCGLTQELSLYGKATKGRYGKKSICRGCERAYIEANKAKLNAYWMERLRARRARKKAERPEFCGPTFEGHLKVCCACKQLHPISAFHVGSAQKDGLQRRCKACAAVSAQKYRAKHPKKVEQTRRDWRANNPEKAQQERKRAYTSRLERLGPSFYLQVRVSGGIRRSLKSGKEGRSSFSLLDFTLEQLRSHLEKQFVRGMTWENMSQWHIDHIIPLASFGPLEPETAAFRSAWCLSNLRPMWSEENQRKSSKILYLV